MAGSDRIGPSTDYSDPSSPAGPPGGPIAANPLWQQAMDEAGLSQAGSPPATPASAPGQNGTTGSAAAFVAPASPAAGGVLAWAARNGAALAGAGAAGLAGSILLTPTNAQRQTTELGVDGHPDIGARMDTAPGSRSGTVTLYPRGQDGQPASPGLKLDMDPNGQLTGPRGTPYDGMAFGSVAQDGSAKVQLAPRARDALAPASSSSSAGSATTPQAAASGPSPPGKPQLGTTYETRTQQEADLAASLQAQGKGGQDIQAALDETRGNAGVGATGVTTKQPVAVVDGALPYADKAVIDPKKITNYSLDPDNQSGGADKARVFKSALGFDKSNSDELIAQIKKGVTKFPAKLGLSDQYGQRYNVDIPVSGPNGSAVVRTGWIVDQGSSDPRLVTAYVKK